MEKLISVAVMRASDAAEIAGGTDSKTPDVPCRARLVSELGLARQN